MDIPTSASNAVTLQPSWERHPEFSTRLRPYSTAAVVYDGSRPQPELWDICNGCILWLPRKKDIGNIVDPPLSSRPPAFFDHPILVLAIHTTSPRDATVRFVKMTSLRNTSLEQHKPPSHWDRYLPISPASPHPNSNILLHVEHERSKGSMVDNSYVSIGEGVFSMDYKALRCYAAGQKADGYRHRLKEESFGQVMRALGKTPSAWVETGSLWEEFVSKHVPTAG